MSDQGLYQQYSIFLFFVFVLLSSCTKSEKRVDRDYLNSQEFRELKENTSREISEKNNAPDYLGDYLSSLFNCEGASIITAPVTMGWEEVEKLRNSSAKTCQKELEGRTVIYLGQIKRGDLGVASYLIDNRSAYRDAELIVATFKDRSLRSFKTVGVFKKIPAKTIHTSLSIAQKSGDIYIEAETERNIQYPLEQNNTILTEYKIGADGGITEI